MAEKELTRLIRNWHRAVDSRGLNESSRSQFCEELLDWLLAD